MNRLSEQWLVSIIEWQTLCQKIDMICLKKFKSSMRIQGLDHITAGCCATLNKTLNLCVQILLL